MSDKFTHPRGGAGDALAPRNDDARVGAGIGGETAHGKGPLNFRATALLVVDVGLLIALAAVVAVLAWKGLGR